MSSSLWRGNGVIIWFYIHFFKLVFISSAIVKLMFICHLKEKIQGKYSEDTSTQLDKHAYMYSAREANRGICNGLGSTTRSEL